MTASAAVLTEDAGAPPRRRRGRLVGLVLVAVLVASGLAAWWFVVDGPGETVPADGDVVTLEPLTATVGDDQLRHARVALGIVLVDGADPARIGPKTPLLKDALLQELAGMSADEVRSAEGSQRLRAALSDRAVEIWGEEVVRRVVLTELLVQ